MTEIAIISDIHGNLEALKTVLKDIEKRKIKKIYCLGDIIAKGCNQQACVDLVREKCTIVISGNCEDFFMNEIDLTQQNEIAIARINWNRKKIKQETAQYLRNLPFCYEFYLSGRLVRLVHAHPETCYRFIGNVDKIERQYELFLPSKKTLSDKRADILIYGHLHTPYMQKIYNRIILNPGSVGNALDIYRNPLKDGDERNTTVANYLILRGVEDSHNWEDEISYEIVNLNYDIEKELKSNDIKDNIEFNKYKEELLHGKYRDMEKVKRSLPEQGIEQDKI